MISKISIINHALMMLGNNPLTSPDEDSSDALAIRVVYDTVLHSLLSFVPWSFAMRRKILNMSNNEEPEWGFRNSFNIPEDCLNVTVDANEYDYKIENRKILTNTNSISILYISSDINIQHVSPSFAEAFASKLAISLCVKLSGSHAKLSDIAAIYSDNLRNAIQINSSESSYEDIRTTWNVARF